MPGPYSNYTNTAATTAAVTNRFVTSTNHKVGAYTVANASPVWSGGCHVTVTSTQVGGVDDTLGTVVFVGTGMNGQAVTETLTPVNGSTVEGTVVFRTVASVTGVGWVINTGNDTLVCGAAAGSYAADGGGILGAVLVNNSVAAAIVVSDKRGTILTVPASQAAGSYYPLDVQYVGYLKVATTSTNDVTLTHTGSSNISFATS